MILHSSANEGEPPATGSLKIASNLVVDVKPLKPLDEIPEHDLLVDAHTIFRFSPRAPHFSYRYVCTPTPWLNASISRDVAAELNQIFCGRRDELLQPFEENFSDVHVGIGKHLNIISFDCDDFLERPVGDPTHEAPQLRELVRLMGAQPGGLFGVIISGKTVDGTTVAYVWSSTHDRYDILGYGG